MSKTTTLPKAPYLLEKQIGYTFKNPNLLLEALTHKSCKKPYNNERLEFLGDAVLDLLVGEYLFYKFPHSQEGELSKLRACIVNEKGFMKLAKSIELGDFLHIASSEESNKGREKASILSNAFEAVMGAIYLESQLTCLRDIVYNLLEKNYAKIDMNTLFMDKKIFEIALCIQGIEYAKCKGHSKKEAQQKSAQIAYEKISQKNSLHKE